MRVIFMGTPDFAVQTLKKLVEDQWNVVAVYTQPDKPKNRGMKLIPTPVKEYALTKNIPVFQPISCKDEVVIEEIRAMEPDVIVVAAYGMLLPQALLDIPKVAIINVHSSILPQYRGAAPINWAILNGDKMTGVSIQYMVQELDAGDILLAKETAIDPEEDAAQLYERLAILGGEAASEALTRLRDGTAMRTPQAFGPEHQYASKLSREMSPIDFSKPAQTIINQIRGLIPWPCATTEIAGVKVKLFKAETGETTNKEPGTITRVLKDGIEIACGDHNTIIIRELQGEGGRRMPAADYLRGHPIHI